MPILVKKFHEIKYCINQFVCYRTALYKYSASVSMLTRCHSLECGPEDLLLKCIINKQLCDPCHPNQIY